MHKYLKELCEAVNNPSFVLAAEEFENRILPKYYRQHKKGYLTNDELFRICGADVFFPYSLTFTWFFSLMNLHDLAKCYYYGDGMLSGMLSQDCYDRLSDEYMKYLNDELPVSTAGAPWLMRCDRLTYTLVHCDQWRLEKCPNDLAGDGEDRVASVDDVFRFFKLCDILGFNPLDYYEVMPNGLDYPKVSLDGGLKKHVYTARVDIPFRTLDSRVSIKGDYRDIAGNIFRLVGDDGTVCEIEAIGNERIVNSDYIVWRGKIVDYTDPEDPNVRIQLYATKEPNVYEVSFMDVPSYDTKPATPPNKYLRKIPRWEPFWMWFDNRRKKRDDAVSENPSRESPEEKFREFAREVCEEK